MDVEEKILSYLEIADLPEDMQYFAECLGMDNIKKLMRYGGGFRISIPLPKSYKAVALEKHLRSIGKKLDYLTKVRIAREFEVSENTINTLLQKIYGDCNENQLSIL